MASELAKKHPHYHKDVSALDTIDVYRVLVLFNVTDPCLQHAIKKLLVAGGRGAGKDINKDVKEAADSCQRFLEMRDEEQVNVLRRVEGHDQVVHAEDFQPMLINNVNIKYIVKHMANRFLGWKLPVNFSPDGGIKYNPVYPTPIGTNLFNAQQAEEMVRYMVEGL
jgi:hypothetical protein